MALRSKAGPDGAEQCLKGVDKEMKFLSLSWLPQHKGSFISGLLLTQDPLCPSKKKKKREGSDVFIFEIEPRGAEKEEEKGEGQNLS